MMKNIAALKGACTGCGACKVVCSKDAISVVLNEDGFYEAVVDSNRCVNCGLCQVVCARTGQNDVPNIRTGTLLAMQSVDNAVVSKCTSGGIAYELATHYFKLGFVVAGTIYDYENNQAKMIIATSLEDIEKMRGSKYIQSYENGVITQLVSLAKKDKKQRILVFGTPCQIYGLHCITEYLKMRERFILVDVFCHGVPSYIVWQDFLRECETRTGVSKWKDIKFRNSQKGWHNFILSLDSEREQLEYQSEKCQFYDAFFDDVLLNKACFNCKSRCNGSGADIRLGDFWGSRFQEREDGVSAVLLLSDAGAKVIESQKRLRVLCSTTVDECLKSQSVEPYGKMELQEKAMDELRNGKKLKRVIVNYRKSFSLKAKVKLVVKKSITIFPKELRKKIKVAYRKGQK